MESLASAPRAIGLNEGKLSALLTGVVGNNAALITPARVSVSVVFNLIATFHPQLHENLSSRNFQMPVGQKGSSLLNIHKV
jgi:hypothetical protein